MGKAKFTAAQLNDFLKSSNLVDLSTPLSTVVDNASKLAGDDPTDVNILLITNYAVVTPVEEAQQ
jgi:hypothetical protein